MRRHAGALREFKSDMDLNGLGPDVERPFASIGNLPLRRADVEGPTANFVMFEMD